MKFSVPYVVMLFVAASCSYAQQVMEYPPTRTEQVTEVRFGVAIDDPYRWLEGDVRQSVEVAEWVTLQSSFTNRYLENLAGRDRIRERLRQLWNFERVVPPEKFGEQYFLLKNDGLQNQSVLYRQDRLDSIPQVLIDPNTWSEDGTVSLRGLHFSKTGKYCVFGRSEKGSDWVTLQVIETTTGNIISREINWVKFGKIAWLPDETGFFYNRFPEVPEEERFQGANLNQKIYFRSLVNGNPETQSEDQLVLEVPHEPSWLLEPEVTSDGRYLLVTIVVGTDNRYALKFKSLDRPNAEFIDLVTGFENEYTFIGSNGSDLLFLSDFQAPKRGILSISLNEPSRENWRYVVPECEETIQSVNWVGNTLIALYLKDARSLVKQYGVNGELIREINLPGAGTATGFKGQREHLETFYSFASFNRPPQIFRLDVSTGISELFLSPKIAFTPDDFEVKQVFYTSKDGTQIPMFLCYRKDLDLTKGHPTILRGYGGFANVQSPRFFPDRLQWMEMGGVYAVANIRGGGEYGDAWHKAGTKLQKQNVFDDFIAAAEWLIVNQITSSNQLAISGSSNGGLLVAACMNQRPELFRACLPEVGVMDMLRFHKFKSGRYWVDDYGDTEFNEAEFRAAYAYSPYHNLVSGTEYPATLATTADTDDRVVPCHSFKYIARLQAVQGGKAPVLIRIETSAGHGAASPTSKLIDKAADMWAFLVQHLDFDPTIPTESFGNEK